MRHRFFAAAIACLLVIMVVTISQAAANLNLSKSNINRDQGAVFVAATVSLTGSNQTETVFTTPETGDFVLTQVCVSPVTGGMRLAVRGFGPIVHTSSAPCYIFNPGMSVPKGAPITCSTTSRPSRGDYFCTISGLLYSAPQVIAHAGK
jgi:hypothetical protein